MPVFLQQGSDDKVCNPDGAHFIATNTASKDVLVKVHSLCRVLMHSLLVDGLGPFLDC